MESAPRPEQPTLVHGRLNALAANQLEHVVVGRNVVGPGKSARAGHAQQHLGLGGAELAVVLFEGRLFV